MAYDKHKHYIGEWGAYHAAALVLDISASGISKYIIKERWKKDELAKNKY